MDRVIICNWMQLSIDRMAFELTSLLEYYPFKDEAQTALFKDPVRTAL
jgi:hypothetical protein